MKPTYPSTGAGFQRTSHPAARSVSNNLSNVPKGFRVLADSGDFSLQLMQILSQLGSFAGIPAEGNGSACTERFDMILRLQQIMANLTRLASQETTYVEHYTCYGLLSYADLLLPKGPAELGHHTVAKLTFDKFSALSLSAKNSSNDCLFWSYMMVACTVASSAGRIKETPIAKDCSLHHWKEARSWSTTKGVLKKFFWNRDCLERCKRYWEEEIRSVQLTQDESTKQDLARPPSARVMESV